MMVTFLFGILAACALSLGCVAQAGTEDPTGSSEQGVSTTVTAEQQQAAPRTSLLRTSNPAQVLVVRPVEQLPNLKGLAGTDPSAPVSDDGDGKEPDPHPWHMDTTVTTAVQR